MFKMFKDTYIKYLRYVAEREGIKTTNKKLNQIFDSNWGKGFSLITEDLFESWVGLTYDEIQDDFISLFNQGTFIAYEDAVKYLETK